MDSSRTWEEPGTTPGAAAPIRIQLASEPAPTFPSRKARPKVSTPTYASRTKLYAADLDFRPIAAEFHLATEFPEEVLAAAAQATDRFAAERIDARSIEFVTIDPTGSKDLDQAVCIERLDPTATGPDAGPGEGAAAGYRVYYAIADVAAFVEPGGVIEEKSLRRGQTMYLPDEPVRLHPARISEDAASLLPNVDRPAVLWTIDLDAEGEAVSADVRRAVIHSRAQLDYEGVHRDLQSGSLHRGIELLPEVGKLRQASALRRQAINLNLPSQRVERLADGRFELQIEPRYEVMDYNSEISLLTGMCAGTMMRRAGRGILRMLEPADDSATDKFRREAATLGFDVPGEGLGQVGEFLAAVDVATPKGLAVMREAQKLLRGADYLSLDAAGVEPKIHSEIGGYYAHVTAPLRRLVDRYATEYCLAICAARRGQAAGARNEQQGPGNPGVNVPSWAAERADAVVQAMRETSKTANQVGRACLRLTEATVLAPWVGHNFPAVVLATDEEQRSARIFVTDPPVMAQCSGAPVEGTEDLVSLVRADVASREVAFAWPAD